MAPAARAQAPAIADTAVRGSVPRIGVPRAAEPDTVTPRALHPAAIDTTLRPSFRDTTALAPRPAAPETLSLRGHHRRVGLGPDTTGAARRAENPGFLTAPPWVMLRSVVFPGWGQMENGAWLKALLLGATDGYLRVHAVKDERDIRRMTPEVNQAQAAYNTATATVSELSDEYDAAVAAHDTLLAAALFTQLQQATNVQNHAGARYNALADSYNNLLNGQISRLWILGGVVVYSMIDAYVDAHFRNFKVEFEHDPALPGGKPGTAKSRLYLRWSF